VKIHRSNGEYAGDLLQEFRPLQAAALLEGTPSLLAPVWKITLNFLPVFTTIRKAADKRYPRLSPTVSLTKDNLQPDHGKANKE
jgi:hypothetical protein